MKKNAFELADHRFLITGQAGIQVTYLDSDIVRLCLDTIKKAFHTLDYSDNYQSRLGFGLFRLRCSIFFGLAQYFHEELQLLEQGNELMAMADSLPGSRDVIAHLVGQLKQLRGAPNPKLEWILQKDWKEENVVIFTPMAMGKSFGTHLIAEQKGHHLSVIHSMSELGSGKYSTLVLPGTMRYLSYGLSMKLLHRGEFAKICVLLFEAESLDLKSRYRLPISPLFPELSSRGYLKIEYSRKEVGVKEESPIPYELDSGKANSQTINSVARLLLFENGTELHVAENECLHVWRPESADGLMKIHPIQLLEGDYLVLEKGQRNELHHLDNEDFGFRHELDTTEAWRGPLNAMLLNHTPREVAALMLGTDYLSRFDSYVPEVNNEFAGLRNLQVNVVQWADGHVFGPGHISHMRAMVSILVKSGLLEINRSIDEAADAWFATLQSIRARRRAAGVNLSNHRDQLLKELLSKRTGLEGAEELVLSNGMVMSLHKLAIVGDPVRVEPDALRKEPVRGAFRWLE